MADTEKKCKHCLGCNKNELGEDIAYCEIWDLWRNVTLGDCFGNCEDEEKEDAKNNQGY